MPFSSVGDERSVSSPPKEIRTCYDLSTCRQRPSGGAGGVTGGQTTGEALEAAWPGLETGERRNCFHPTGSWTFPSHHHVFRLGVCKGFKEKRLRCGQILHVGKRVLFLCFLTVWIAESSGAHNTLQRIKYK